MLLQFVVLTTHGLANRLSITGQLRWSARMAAASWEDLLRNRPAGTMVTQNWKNSPALDGDGSGRGMCRRRHQIHHQIRVSDARHAQV
ncbi:hypothetical protein OK006_10724 [Actinobacteria bacterium OK006]|nr:hypothetical protein OK006_10724 [Actinobacteria bacterium OK006]